MKKLYYLVLGVLCLSLAASPAWCGSQSAASSKMTVKKVVIVQPNYLVPWLPIYLADQLGYFKEEGLDVGFVTVMGGHNVHAAVIKGDAHFGLTGYEQVLKTYQQGKSTKMIMTTTKLHPWSYFGSKKIKSIADLKGKKIDGGLEGSSYRSFARAVVKYGGLDPNKDVMFVNIPRGSEIAALEKGDIDGVLGIDNMKIELLRRGYQPLVDMVEPAQHKAVIGYDEYPLFVVQVNDALVKNDPDMIQRFTNAVVRAMYWQKIHNPAQVAAKARPTFSSADPKVFDETIAFTLKALSMDGYFTKDGHKAAEKFGLDVEFITAPVAMELVVDETFLKKAHEKTKKESKKESKK